MHVSRTQVKPIAETQQAGTEVIQHRQKSSKAGTQQKRRRQYKKTNLAAVAEIQNGRTQAGIRCRSMFQWQAPRIQTQQNNPAGRQAGGRTKPRKRQAKLVGRTASRQAGR